MTRADLVAYTGFDFPDIAGDFRRYFNSAHGLFTPVVDQSRKYQESKLS